MSTFTTATARGLDVLYKRSGELANYRFEDGFRQDCTLVVERDATRYGDVAEIAAQSVVCRVRRSELNDRPLQGEKFLLSASCEEYVVSEVIRSETLEYWFVAA